MTVGTFTIWPEISYGCPLCSTYFYGKRDLVRHLNNSCINNQEQHKYKVKFRKTQR